MNDFGWRVSKGQIVKDEEVRSLLPKKGYRILELHYNNYSDNTRDQLYNELIENLRKE